MNKIIENKHDSNWYVYIQGNNVDVRDERLLDSEYTLGYECENEKEAKWVAHIIKDSMLLFTNKVTVTSL